MLFFIDKETKKGIEESKYFSIIGTKNFFSDTNKLNQVCYAKHLKKPFRILLAKDTLMPEGFLDGVEDYKIAEFDPDDPTTMKKAVNSIFPNKL